MILLAGTKPTNINIQLTRERETSLASIQTATSSSNKAFGREETYQEKKWDDRQSAGQKLPREGLAGGLNPLEKLSLDYTAEQHTAVNTSALYEGTITQERGD